MDIVSVTMTALRSIFWLHYLSAELYHQSPRHLERSVMSTSAHRDQAADPQGGNSQGANPGRFRANQPGTHTLAVRGLDRYPTPRIAVEKLLEAEPDVLNTMA